MTSTKLKVFLVEDEALVSMLIEDMVADLGHEISVCAADLQAGVAAAAQDFDVALLDVNLHGMASYPIADILVKREIPFAFLSGYGAHGIDPRFSHVPTARKPFTSDDLERLLERLGAARRPQT